MAKNQTAAAATPPDDEATIKRELEAIQAERVTFEDGIRRALRDADDAHRKVHADAGAAMRDGLAAIDGRHAEASRRLDAARAERLKAEARAADRARQAAREAGATPNA
jgi:hypothetical protein